MVPRPGSEQPPPTLCLTCLDDRRLRRTRLGTCMVLMVPMIMNRHIMMQDSLSADVMSDIIFNDSVIDMYSY